MFTLRTTTMTRLHPQLKNIIHNITPNGYIYKKYVSHTCNSIKNTPSPTIHEIAYTEEYNYFNDNTKNKEFQKKQWGIDSFLSIVMISCFWLTYTSYVKNKYYVIVIRKKYSNN